MTSVIRSPTRSVPCAISLGGVFPPILERAGLARRWRTIGRTSLAATLDDRATRARLSPVVENALYSAASRPQTVAKHAPGANAIIRLGIHDAAAPVGGSK
jgi:hypothetical protein